MKRTKNKSYITDKGIYEGSIRLAHKTGRCAHFLMRIGGQQRCVDNRTGRLQVFIRHTGVFHVEHYHGHGKFREIVSRETIDNKFYK